MAFVVGTRDSIHYLAYLASALQSRERRDNESTNQNPDFSRAKNASSAGRAVNHLSTILSRGRITQTINEEDRVVAVTANLFDSSGCNVWVMSSPATSPVSSPRISEEIKRQFAAQLPTLLETFKKNLPAQPVASSSAPKKALSSSSTKKPEQKTKDPKSKPKPNTKPAHAAKASNSNSRAKPAGNRGGGSGAKQEEMLSKRKGKQKATEEPLDSDSP